jgi:hypothetical protein
MTKQMSTLNTLQCGCHQSASLHSKLRISPHPPPTPKKKFQCWIFLLPSENTNKPTYTIREEAKWMKMKRDSVILKFKIRRKKGIKSEWERTGIKSRNGGYNQHEKEGLNNQKQNLKRKIFKKREKWNETRQKNMKMKEDNDGNVSGSKAEQNRTGWYSCKGRWTEIRDVKNTECKLKLNRKVISLSGILEWKISRNTFVHKVLFKCKLTDCVKVPSSDFEM